MNLRLPLSLLMTAAALWLALPVREAPAAELATDISAHLVAIRSNFTGSQILLFGAVTDTGGDLAEHDIVIVARGPDVDRIERRKERVFGVWINRHAALFADIPGFYAVASTRPLGIIAASDDNGGESAHGLFARNAIGMENLRLNPTDARSREGLGKQESDIYRDALLRHFAEAGLYGEQPGTVSFLGDSLFRAEMDLPAQVPAGSYEIEVYLFKDGAILDAQSLPLFVNKIGVGRYLFQTAHQSPLLYGICAVILALLIGWLAGIIFDRK